MLIYYECYTELKLLLKKKKQERTWEIDKENKYLRKRYIIFGLQ